MKLKIEITKYKLEVIQIKLDKTYIANKVSSLKLKIRDQTEADLFFVSSIICAKLLKGEKKESLKKEIKEYDTLRDMERMAQQQRMAHRHFNPLGGLYGRTFGY